MNTNSLDTLNKQFAIHQKHVDIYLSQNEHGFPILNVRNPHADACFSLYGAQMLSYKPHASTHDLFFLSEKAIYQTGKAIRGGAPLCWPWFGPDPEQKGRPAHGFARTNMWQLDKVEQLEDQSSVVILTLKDTAETYEIWPYHFRLTLQVVIGDTLKMSLITENLSDQPMPITQAIHSYFAVGDIAQVQVDGLEDLSYIDKSKLGQNQTRMQNGAITVDQEVDRIYLNSPDQVQIVDHSWQQTVHIHNQNSQTTVVWNPWIDICQQMNDLQNNDYKRFVCVETANVGNRIVTIKPSNNCILGCEYKFTKSQ